jgi:hypothetical protein
LLPLKPLYTLDDVEKQVKLKMSQGFKGIKHYNYQVASKLDIPKLRQAREVAGKIFH